MPPPKKPSSSFRRRYANVEIYIYTHTVASLNFVVLHRWGHRRSNSLDVPIARSMSAEPVDAMAAAASSGIVKTSVAQKQLSCSCW